MPKNSLNVSLKGADDIFSTEESRQEQQREQVQQIPIGELFPFKDHPFKVLDDESMDSCCLFQCWRYASLKHGSVQQVVLVLNLPACAPCEPFLQVLSSQNSASSFTSIVLYRSGE